MDSIIVGTSGHIDHGKTALIKELNGFEGDELGAEKERGITIDLSFSNLSNGKTNIAFIDVPGHENLVKTMISGAYAFDVSMLIVASDDGLMPQTKEHIEILSLLGIKSVILCITKCDLTDKKRQKEVEKEVEDYISKFESLKTLQTFFVSIKYKTSIDELRNYLFTIKPKQRDESIVARYYIDRIFTLKGVGTIITGSLIEGTISKNEKLICLDNNKQVTVRSVQVHDNFVDIATSPNRVALNLANITVNSLEKGQILSKKGFFRGFKEIDCFVSGEISHNENLTFCIGSRQLSAKCKILSQKDNKSFVTFKFDKNVFAKFNEPFVILRNSRVVGGGKVLNPVSEPLKKSEKIKLLVALLDKNFKTAFEILTQNHKHGFGLISSYQRFNLSHEEALSIAKSLNNVFIDSENLCIYANGAIDDLKEIIKFIISKNEFAVISAQSVALRTTWVSEVLANFVLNELLKANVLEKNGMLFVKKGIDFSKIEKSLNDKIYTILENANLTPDAPYNIYDELDIDRVTGDNALKSLTATKRVVRLAHNLFVTSSNLDLAMKKIREIILKDGKANVQNVKNELGLSRKFAISYLEHLDKFDDIIKIDNDRKFLNSI
ncbi:selenocysteine-specific elongation factor [Campylobacter blaseri]|uniref:Selenocysteine-specific elongation factor n=1 Tax=Campylobacter blaseri TaxID=2042961 RepID=A0A2P8R417_9BACT|nr:selenocysteine-specific translation elongation factor [Campylobacter blaseri]PSM53257.1 selenocysteine-specific translation elongation factor [Campylobacter blaseri]PSM54723.1 selenocysteine-specific translation elongation factor [Campylobacter blaseri]QKF86794.1 selenocysteine-specific elongation factor [Campylobacter blaseri]